MVADVLEKEGIETEILHVDETGGAWQRNNYATGKRGQDLYELYPLI